MNYFKESLIDGILLFCNPSVVLVVTVYFIAFFIPRLFIDIVFDEDSDPRTRTKAMFKVTTFLTAVLTIGFVVSTLSPILLGISKTPMWYLPYEIIIGRPGAVLVGLVIIYLLQLLIACVPVVNYLISLYMLVTGILTLLFTISIKHKINPFFEFQKIKMVLPGGIEGLYFIGLCFLVTLLGITPLALVKLKLKKYSGLLLDHVGLNLMLIINLIPIFVYGAWLKHQIIGSLRP